MTIFEEGYLAHSKGQPLDSNPYDKLEQSYSYNKWNAGWKARQKRMIEIAR